MAYLTTPNYKVKEQPIPEIGDKIQLLTCTGDYNHKYDNSIWKVRRVHGYTINMVETGKDGCSEGSIDVGGPWSWKVLPYDWDE